MCFQDLGHCSQNSCAISAITFAKLSQTAINLSYRKRAFPEALFYRSSAKGTSTNEVRTFLDISAKTLVSLKERRYDVMTLVTFAKQKATMHVYSSPFYRHGQHEAHAGDIPEEGAEPG